MTATADTCPCGLGAPLAACCGRFLDGRAHPPTAEALMRSRYTAWATGHIDWLATTSTGAAARAFSRTEAEAWARSARFTALRVLETRLGGPLDRAGEVLFEADFEERGRRDTLRERSRFERVDTPTSGAPEREDAGASEAKPCGVWRYAGTAPTARAAKGVGRNDPCPCGSGLKAKRCCGA